MTERFDPGVEAQETGREDQIAAAAEVVQRLVRLLPPGVLLETGEAGDLAGFRTPSIRVEKPAGQYRFISYTDEGLAGAKASVVKDIYDNETGASYSTRWLVGERDERGRPGVRMEQVDLSTTDPEEPAGGQKWLNGKEIGDLVVQLGTVEQAVVAGEYELVKEKPATSE